MQCTIGLVPDVHLGVTVVEFSFILGTFFTLLLQLLKDLDFRE